MSKEKKAFLKKAKLKYRLNNAKARFLRAHSVTLKGSSIMREFIEKSIDEDLKIDIWGNINGSEQLLYTDDTFLDDGIKNLFVYNLGVEYMFELSSAIKSIRDRYKQKLKLIKESTMEELKND